MFLLIFISILVIILVGFLLRSGKKSIPKVYFIGPHSAGKTVSILNLLGLSNKTVTTLSDHRVVFKNKELIELVPDDTTHDFLKKFRLNSDDKFVFFVKNEEEMDAFPDCSPFRVTFVMWKKTESNSRKDLVYLDESREKLGDLIAKL